MPTRRLMLAAALSALSTAPRAAPLDGDTLAERFAAIERTCGGRLGVAVREAGTVSGVMTGHRADERFPMCSTFKLLAASAVLARVDAGREHLERVVPYTTRDLVDYSPITGARAGDGGLPLSTLCEAALGWSDNTAANLLLATIGGPAGLTEHARALGDPLTRLDRIEPGLNEARPGDPRDTTSPAAMACNLERLLIGDALRPASRAYLTAWLVGSRTGGARLRAGVPAGWEVGDKTGTGGYGTTNDVAVLRPPGRAPLLVAVYMTQTTLRLDAREAAIAAVARALAS